MHLRCISVCVRDKNKVDEELVVVYRFQAFAFEGQGCENFRNCELSSQPGQVQDVFSISAHWMFLQICGNWCIARSQKVGDLSPGRRPRQIACCRGLLYWVNIQYVRVTKL